MSSSINSTAMEPTDVIETCPYDKAHRIRRSRMQFHLTACSKNHPNAKVRRCHYDARHVVREDEFDKHLMECPARDVVQQPLDGENDTQELPYILSIDTSQNTNSDDWGAGEWESETNCQSYSPLDAIQNRPIVHAKIGLSKAQRKKHRLQERKRFNEVTEANAANKDKF